MVLELGNRSIEYVVTSYQLLHIGIAAIPIPARKGSLSYNFASYYYRLCLQMHQINGIEMEYTALPAIYFLR